MYIHVLQVVVTAWRHGNEGFTSQQCQCLACRVHCHAITNLLHAPDWMLLSDACDVRQIDWEPRQQGNWKPYKLWSSRRTSTEACLISKAFVAMILLRRSLYTLNCGLVSVGSRHTRRFVLAHGWSGTVCSARGTVRVVIHQPRSERQLCTNYCKVWYSS